MERPYSCDKHRIINHPDIGCHLCNRERQKATKKPTKKTYEIPKISPKKAKRESELAKVRTAKKKAVTWCQSCTRAEGPLDYSHILSVKHYPRHETNPLNAVIECRKCHEVWEHGTLDEKMRQRSWGYKEMVIRHLEPTHLEKMQLKSAS